jgi:hypothetical protein
VRQLAAAFAQAGLLAVFLSGQRRRASSPQESGSKLPHSKALAPQDSSTVYISNVYSSGEIAESRSRIIDSFLAFYSHANKRRKTSITGGGK